ncbi:uncharacterized protein LOC131269123 [Anopheles coustani]|nr:uncharacterized protein LOC131269123 [Anopheles coustani]
MVAAALSDGVAAKQLPGASRIDVLRQSYLQQEALSWMIVNQMDKVANQLHEDTARQRAVVLSELFENYLRFAADSRLAPEDRGDYRLLGRQPEWAQLEQNFLNVNKLYGVVYAFLYEQRDQLAKRANQTDVSNEVSGAVHDDISDLHLHIVDLAETILFDKRFPIAKQLEQIYNIMVVQAVYYRASLTASSAMCGFGLSPQQMIYSLYESVALTELKGYIMMQFSYMLLKTQGKGNFTVESEERKLEMKTRLNRTQDLLQRVMQQTRSDYWRCDPEQGAHRENETYVQVTRLLQGYIENEVDMNTDKTCWESCSHYQYGHEQHQCYKELYCAKQPKCAGRIYECEFIDSDMTICPAAPGSQRRYEYIEYENGELRGRKLSYCPYGTTQVQSWWRWLFWHCSYCFCLCDDAGRHSDRYVSLRQSVSDIANNRVVTGLRFVKAKQVIHLIVQQGRLMPGGEIQNDTIEWVTPARFSPLDRGIRSEKDYHTLTYEKRAIDLDDIRVSAGYVLTGVRFRLLGSHLNLEIRMTEMNFTSGTLIDLDKSIWIGNDDTERTEIAMKYKDIPTRATGKSVPVSRTGQFLRFGPTGGRADAHQTTIPFMDAQPVYTIRPGPLSGAGLLYKSVPNFGGYIAPKLFSYDFGPHIQTPADDWFAAEQLKRSELEERSNFG